MPEIDIDSIRRNFSLNPRWAEPEIPSLCDEIESLREQVTVAREFRDLADQHAKAAVQAEMAKVRSELSRALHCITLIRTKLQEIVCTKDPDKGVVLLSQDGPCHKETWNGQVVNVYDHEHFSPLGDALIELHQLTDLSNWTE